ncbi:MAG: hypothetical protein CO031_01920 [Candidatus Nealsonbacteria bacterium CG_4_9_14_0_2_um_filter_37_38]|uniref:Uncharacterized protein n=1 Tax=Candidatus Nealsonbacteria bacterium CG_4_10_14_0_8_um_filter_37_14 TaxID=1974684 RepID=A0A2M7R6I4_9BACT|nr:MAG: hypothetical protein COV63_03455 [Candidatus Nealsonbacteria bacterium CG11_big_fil_rev_8_21_14_0_20_37_68]PIW92073.1 MAG: hypothetical protein COZ89_02070 [Candidatus Nealsonbacteria bacterium CG_4_8_14_3_um_filter_37_23]PIY88900.1 MAG: hypothetical protein COY73_02510 [Candidatus Nealsonbacteria bacterium CG_4_10_14_0_8_um_filter_37_14]PJC51569.1 MAG: hypothetical protein CO031_01920 [Candidatus Nealsonbacteria bacterium CG_4_9_14_0_2_um_filter_37_38]
MQDIQNNEMEKAGWEEVCRSGGAHLNRVKAEYEELGFEVKLVPLSLNECGECIICYREGNGQLYKVFVRKISESGL